MGEANFEEAMKRIEKIVADLEKGDLPLEESLDRFEEAIKLARSCQEKLEKAEARISKLVRTGENGFRLEPLEDSGQD
jgi:exodeoxyribonuclease VII small subunit